MNIHEYLNEMKEFQTQLLSFSEINDEDDIYFTLNLLNETVEEMFKDKTEFTLFLRFISKIAKNHHRGPYFIKIIEKIILNYKTKITQLFSNLEIYNIFKGNKRILYFLFENKIITADQTIINNLFQKYDTFDECSILYFIPQINDKLNDQQKEFYEIKISKFKHNTHDNLDNLCKIGENNSKIACFIRSDSAKDFISFVNSNKISLSSHIQPSVFETNNLLIKNNPSLIEYASFFGSIQIVQYLKLSGIELTSSLWIYAIHSNNPDMIHLLESENIEPDDNNFEICLKEAIKCHHNEIAEYIKSNLLHRNQMNFDIKTKLWRNIVLCCFQHLNYISMNFNIVHDIAFYGACKYNHTKMVEHLLKEKDFDLNADIKVNDEILVQLFQ